MQYYGISKGRLLKVMGDFSLIIFSYFLAFLLRFDFLITPDISQLIITLPIVLSIRLILFWYFGLFQTEWRYSSIDDLVSIFKAVSFGSLAIVPAVYLLFGFEGFPRSVFLIDWALLILFAGGLRFSGRVKREVFPPQPKESKRVLIVGTADTLVSIIREMRMSKNKQYNVVALIDDRFKKGRTRIHGVEVVGDRGSIPHIVTTKKIDEVIIAQQNGTKRELWETIELCQLANVKFRIISMSEGVGYHRKFLEQIRDIRLEDLIGRKPVDCDFKQIQRHIEGRRVLISGAGGSIGSELSRQVAGFKPGELILLDRAENGLFYVGIEINRLFPTLQYRQVIADVVNRSQIERVLCQYQPDLIFHAAAHKHVPMMELNPGEAIKNNVLGTRNIAEAAIHNGVSEFVFISTDKAVKPMSFMGLSKRIAEQYMQGLSGLSQTKFLTVRFGNVLGSTGSVIRLFKEQLERGGPITVTHPEATRYFMSIPEAVQLILQATLFGKGGEIFILDMGEPVNINSMARAMISLSGKKPDEDVKIVFTGLRPGEKLHEELYEENDKCLPTPHEKIMSLNGVTSFDFDLLKSQIEELEKGIDEIDRYALAEKLKTIVPGFQPIPQSMLHRMLTGIAEPVFNEDDKAAR